MLVTFSCKAYENVTLFGDVALRLLTMMGHSGSVPSALTAEEVPHALESLQNAILQTQSPNQHHLHQDKGHHSSVSINHRAMPLINLLQAAVKNHTYVSWKEGF